MCSLFREKVREKKNAEMYKYLYGPDPGFDVLLSLLDAKLHVADVRAELPGFVAVKCSVL